MKQQLKYKSILFCLLAVLIFPLNAQQLSLEDAIAKSLENNYQIKISGLKTDISKNNNNWGAAGLLPSLSLNANGNYNNSDNDGAITKTTTFAPAINLNWTLFSGFKVKISKEKFEELQRISEESYQLLVETSIQSTILEYHKLLVEKEKLNILSEVMKLSRDRYKRSQMQKELGSALSFDVLQAQNAYLSDSSSFILQKVNLDNARRALNFVMGEPTANVYELSDSFTVAPQKHEFETLLTQMINNNKNLQLKYLSNQLLAKDVSMAKSNMFPSLSLSAGYGKNIRKIESSINPPETNSWDYNIGLRLNYILYNGGNIKRAVDNVKISMQIGAIEMEEMKFQLTNVLFTTHALYEARKQILAVSVEQLKASKLNLQIAEEKFESGAINSFNYRDVQIAYLNAAYGHLQAKYQLLSSETELLQLTGNLVAQ